MTSSLNDDKLVLGGLVLGGGVGWLLVVIALHGRYVHRGGIPYGIGWWVFTFPLGALSLATSLRANAWKLPVESDIAFGSFVGLVVADLRRKSIADQVAGAGSIASLPRAHGRYCLCRR